ncbi:helix-turn-helix domain-containing protein [Micromonospora halophytica]|uniref:Transcriptional regulator, contains XRE-family HTH domain n=1 Tax=Micromonospora halophytica TaxID=47864 RepID=A0A1C5H3T2_9ACTN|nr:helix-turn-helix transcriptional regulator [Micromonospora halophytica]SCG40547.1 Transcriptional regulator, contains XRE-family HTH domain [Micromonospora halophytica]
MSLLRRVIGAVLRRVRQRQGRTLREVAEAAGVSLPYLSEVERGRKEASSEVLAAICRALGISLSDLLEEARDDLRRVERRVPAAPRAALARLERVPAARGDAAGPRLRVGFHPDATAAEPRAATPVTGGRLLPLDAAPTVTGGRLLHVGGSAFGTGATALAAGGMAPHAGSPFGGAGLRVRLFAAPAGRPAARTSRLLVRRRARIGRRRLTAR